MKVKAGLLRNIISSLFPLLIAFNILATANAGATHLIVATIDHQKIEADIEDFPVMLKLNDTEAPDFFERIVSNPDNSLKFKVEFNSSSQCFVEKELWDYETRSVFLHVKVPLISATEDTVLTLTYDENMPDNTDFIGDVGSPAAQNVWDRHFTHVLHLTEVGNSSVHEYRDSTANGNHGTGVRAPDRVEALIGFGQMFGSMAEGKYIQVDGADPDGSTEVTLEAVFEPDAAVLSGKRHIIQNPGTGSNASIILRHGAYLESWVYTGTSAKAVGTTPLAGATWYYGAGRWKSGEPASVWLNDAQEAIGTERTGNIGRGAADKFEIGNWHGVSKREFVNGVADEIRISSIKRSDAWLKATYHNLFNTLVAYRSGPDSDDDGLLDSDETNLYGTDPIDPDSDGDGHDDGIEAFYWGSDWNTDTDDDGVVNLLDADSDNDSVSDGNEIARGFDPADQNSYPPQIVSIITVTIDHNNIDADLVDFPVTLKLDDTNARDFFERIVSNPANALKFRVQDPTGSLCYVEKELWDSDNRMVILHVKIPFVSSSEDTVLRLLYDETMVDHATHIGGVGSRPAQNVWDPYFTHVLHLCETGNGTVDEYRDSTARGHHGTGVIAPHRIPTPIGHGQSLGLKSDGEYIQVDGPDPDGSTEITLEAVFKPDAGSLSKYRHILQNPGRGQRASIFLRHGKYFEAWMFIGGAASAKATTPLVGGTWYYGAGRWRSGEPVSAWLNDSQEAESAVRNGTIGRGKPDLYEIGNWHSISGREFENGAVDEIRISSIKRSKAWLKATYHSLFNTLVDYEFGPDSDGDGILDNDEIDIYGTDPYIADTDGDGINDGDELAYWGESWDADADGDGLINLLDPDSDNDGLLDGEEIDQGFDPADPGHFPLPGPGYRDVDYGFDHDEQQGGGGLISETVRLLNGNIVENRTDLSFPSPHRLGLVLNAYYNSRSGSQGNLGYGWTHSYEACLDTRFRISGQTYLKVVDQTRRAHYFRLQSPGTYSGAFAEKSQVRIEGGSYVWYRLDGVRYGFSTRGRLIWIDDSAGNRITVRYDADGLLDTVTDMASGRKLRFHYTNGLIDYIEGPTTEAAPDGKWVSYDYDANRNLTSVTYADGSGFDYSYNDTYQVHNLTEKKDKLGHLLDTWSYDQYDRCIGTSNTNGQGVSIRHVTDNEVEVTDDYGVLRTYTLAEVSGRKRVTAMEGAAIPPFSDSYAVNWTYDNDLNLSEVEYANSTVNQYQDYDTNGNPRTTILAAGKSAERIITWTYHPDMSVPLTRTEPSVLGTGNKVIIWDYDDDYDGTPNESPSGLISRIVELGFTKNTSGLTVPYEYVTTFTYNEQGQVLTIDGPRTDISDITSFEYDPTTGNLNTITRPLIGDTLLPESDYDAAGLAGKIIDVNGQPNRFTYDGRGRIIAVHYDAEGSTQTVTYNGAGLPDYSVDEDGIEKSFEYEGTYGRLYRRYDPENNYIQYLYDDQGNLVEKSKHVENGDRYSRHRWNYQSPDIKGKLWKKIRFDDTFTQYRYFADGNLKSKTDPENRTTRYGYDAFNRLRKIKQTHKTEWDTVTSYGYDAHGNLKSVTDAEGHKTTYIYDDMGSVVKTTSSDTGTTAYAYDQAGNLIQKTDANGVVTQYSYDALNRLTDIDFPTDKDITYSYDEGPNGIGRFTGMTDASGSTIFAYDDRGRLVEKISTVLGHSYTVAQGFSPANRIKFLRYPPDMEGRRLDYIRDEVTGRIKKVSTNYHSKKVTLLDNLSFYPFGAPRTARHYGGKNSSSGGSGGHATKGFPIEIEKSDCGCIQVVNRGKAMEQSYKYYADGNIKSIEGVMLPWFTHHYQYNSLGHLTRDDGYSRTIDFTYDKAGNRLTRTIDDQTETYSYYPGTNRLQSVTGAGTVNYSYDENGNPTSIGNRAYVYNENNRLIIVAGSGSPIAKYTYNGLGQRVLKKVDGVTTVFHYDFRGKLIAEGLPDGTITKHYMYMGSNRLARFDAASKEFAFYANNHLGTPLFMAKYKNATGPVLWDADYKPFGEAEVSPESREVNNFRFPGQYYDEETGLHYNYYRYYSPKTGRYLTPDPIGLIGGNNLFVYVSNNPIRLIDPLGLEFSDILPGIIKAIVEGSKGGSYAFSEAAKATADIAMHGHPLAQTALGVAFISEAVPLVCAGSYIAPEANIALMVWAGTPQGQALLMGSVDYLNSALPGVPIANMAGLSGVISGQIYNKFKHR